VNGAVGRQARLTVGLVVALGVPAGGVASGPAPLLEAEVAERLAQARQVFQDNCGACHGYDGVPTLPETPNFARGERMEKSDAELLETIRRGKGNMPPWEGALSESERRAALGYARLVGGDVEYRDHCLDCHRQGLPALPAGALERVAANPGGGAAIKVCSGSQVDSEMEDEELVSVVRFLGTVAGLPEIEDRSD